MRILRGKSSLEVSSQGFAWFVLGLVFATFIGGAVRTVLSSDRVHARIVRELKARFPKHEFKIGETQVLLSRGMWPGLGLRLKDVRFKQETCGKLSFELNVPEVVLPLDLMKLTRKHVRIGRLQVNEGTIHLNYMDCANELQPVATTSGEPPAAGKKPALEPAAFDWKKASQVLRAMDIHSLSVTYESQPTWKVFIREMELDLDDELSAQGLWEIQKSLPFGEVTHLVEVDAHGDDRLLQWNMQSEFKEGRASVRGSLDLATNVAVIQITGRQLPVKELVYDFHRMDLIERELNLKNAWFSCELKWEGELNRLSEMPVNMRDCRLEGTYGRVELEHADVWPSGKGEDFLKVPARLKVDRLQIQPVLEALNRKFLPTVLSKTGVWSGNVEYQSSSKWNVDGTLEGAEIVFSNQSVRGKQLVEKVRTKLTKDTNSIRARLEDVGIQGGEFSGHIEVNLQDDWRNGTFVTNIERLRLSSAIQNLLVGGSVGTVQVQGEGALVEGELNHWKGRLNLDQMQGRGWGAETVEMNSQYQTGTFKTDGKARKMWLNKSSFPQLQSVLNTTNGMIQWKDLNAKIEIQNNSGSIQNVTGIETTANQIWKLKGDWVRDGSLQGHLTTGSGSKAKSFTVRGEKGVLTLSQSTPSPL